MNKGVLAERIRARLDLWRLALAGRRADLLLALLGLVSGVCAALVIVAFRKTVVMVQQLYMADLPGEAFEWLTPTARAVLPVAGALLLGVMFVLLPGVARTVGVVHVLERLHYHQGYLPWRNMLWQFCGAALALATGQSVGREAPSVHLGAGSASLLGGALALPNNALRTLVACGAAAAIAASFNTPLAGVVFAMEVVMVEYTIAGFAPIILAAVAATAIAQAVFGDETAFLVPLFGLGALRELPYITVMGVMIGCASALFVWLMRTLMGRFATLPAMLPFVLAGLAVGALGAVRPEILGLGYDTVARTLAGQLGLATMAGVFAAKLLASAACLAARMPGGLIGPAVVMGSLAGGCFSHLAAVLPGSSSHPALFAMLGMAAMMGAVLQAPLAALLALLEMTGNPHIILPGMLAVVTAVLTARIVWRQDSVFTLLLRDAGLDYRHDPLSQGLRRIGVGAVMNRSFEQAPRVLGRDDAHALLKRGPQWIIVDQQAEQPLLLRASELARHCESSSGEATDIDLLAIPAERFELRPVHLQATLYEAREIMLREGVEALYVRRQQAPLTFRTFGVLQRTDVEAGYAFGA
ncbi:MAG: chloride channel protein [Gammaproteobacteria bacterium]|nr:chloride channel protein [Gammaproteobacteria bacterium]MCP5201614.1 chloride channel protein [Gammaproteobacteria bacterium]